ncbi:MAG TPA: hypothetical protein VIL20_26290, partial [Sandaracinaceae bacterium]
MSELDRLLAAAREARPDFLAEHEVEAMVRAAKRRASSLERVLAEARRAEPDPLTAEEVLAMAQRAAMTGRARHRSWTRRRIAAICTVAATAAAAAVTFAILAGEQANGPAGDVPPAVAAGPTDLDLPTGDRLVAASGARFEVALPAARVRQVRLRSGSMLFDVQPLEGGRFSVSTPVARID